MLRRRRPETGGRIMAVRFNDELKKRTWERKDKATGKVIASGTYPEWHGRWKDATGWKWHKLYIDKAASRRAWQEFQTRQEQIDAGLITADTDRMKLPVPELNKRFHDNLRHLRRDPDHITISEGMLRRMIDLGGWRRLGDITVDSVTRVLAMLEAQGAGVSYRNKFIKRIKALVNWIIPDGMTSSLKKLKQISEKGAKRSRARRAATVDQQHALLSLDLPVDREMSYALAVLNGLRRNEVRKLREGHLDLTAAIPFLKVKKKNDEKDVWEYVPLHPYVLHLFRRRMPKMPDAPVVKAVPDVETLKKDWKRAGVEFVNADGLRLDYHALRHTFLSTLDLTGASRATKKKLTRHANEDVTDGYAHAELAEMLAALQRLPSPLNPPAAPEAQRATGTDGSTAVGPAERRSRAGHSGFPNGRGPALAGTNGTAMPTCGFPAANAGAGTGCHDRAPLDLIVAASAANLPSPGPDTQVD